MEENYPYNFSLNKVVFGSSCISVKDNLKIFSVEYTTSVHSVDIDSEPLTGCNSV